MGLQPLLSVPSSGILWLGHNREAQPHINGLAKQPSPSLCPGPDYLLEIKQGPGGPLRPRTALPGYQLVPTGAGQQFDHVERESWRLSWVAPTRDMEGLGHPSGPRSSLPLGTGRGES